MSWVLVGDRQRCEVHDPNGERLFAKGQQCAECVRARTVFIPTVEVEDTTTQAAPEGCLPSTEREKTLTAIALYAEEVGRELAGPGEKRHIPHAVKMLELAIKAHRAAGELTRVRERRGYVAHLERQVKKLRGGRN